MLIEESPLYRELEDKLWNDFPGLIDTLVEKSAEHALEIRPCLADLYTKSDIGVYWHPVLEKVGLYSRPFIKEEYQWCVDALTEKLGKDSLYSSPLVDEDLNDWWVKVAYSPTLRRAAELLKFFPNSSKDNFGGRPIASTIASGLLGAGLGYGSGWLLDKITPKALRSKNGRLKYLGAALGGSLGAGLGSLPGLVNLHEGRDFNDKELWDGFPEDGFNRSLPEGPYKEAVEHYVAFQKSAYQIHPEGPASTVGGPSFAEAPLISTNELGQVLWGTKASPQTAAMTMGAIHGANQMPDPRAMPGYVTPHQTGLFGMAMGAAGGGLKGYATGFVVGKGLGILTGMPESTQKTLRQSGAALGIVNSLVPRLFN